MNFLAGFSGFSVKDIAQAKEFYSKKLGLDVEEIKEMGLKLHLPGGSTIFVYEKPNHTPASYTMLNLVVKNIDEVVDELSKKGIVFKQYHMREMPQDEKGIARGLSVGMGPDIAWFTDPSENIVAVLQEK